MSEDDFVQSQRVVVSSVLLAAVGLLPGCRPGDEIRAYEVPHVESASKASKLEPVRLLAGIFPHKDKIWFLMVKGPKSAVTENKDAFDKFIYTVHFGDNPPIGWKLPDAWQQQPGQGLRYATILIPNPQSLELTVTPLGKEAGDLLANINRWRGQIGLPELTKDELQGSQDVKHVEINGAKAALVDMEGHLPGAKRKRAQPTQAAPQGEFRVPTVFDAPKDWIKDPKPARPILFAWSISDGQDKASVTISALPGDGGGWAANVQRWRGQIDLPPAPEESLGDRELAMDHAKARFVDVSNPKAPAGRNRILAVMLFQDNISWFFKMTGPIELVGRQKAAFEEFLRSVRFEVVQGTNR